MQLNPNEGLYHHHNLGHLEALESHLPGDRLRLGLSLRGDASTFVASFILCEYVRGPSFSGLHFLVLHRLGRLVVREVVHLHAGCPGLLSLGGHLVLLFRNGCKLLFLIRKWCLLHLLELKLLHVVKLLYLVLHLLDLVELAIDYLLLLEGIGSLLLALIVVWREAGLSGALNELINLLLPSHFRWKHLSLFAIFYDLDSDVLVIF